MVDAAPDNFPAEFTEGLVEFFTKATDIAVRVDSNEGELFVSPLEQKYSMNRSRAYAHAHGATVWKGYRHRQFEPTPVSRKSDAIVVSFT